VYSGLSLGATGVQGMKILYAKLRKSQVRQSYADIIKARKLLDYNPQVTLEEGDKEAPLDSFGGKLIT
jgi:nucleoside-diphosphate-sugar epimerase